MCKASLIYFLRFFNLRVGREMYNVMPLKSHPRIYFSVDYASSPLMIFLIAAESPPL